MQVKRNTRQSGTVETSGRVSIRPVMIGLTNDGIHSPYTFPEIDPSKLSLYFPIVRPVKD